MLLAAPALAALALAAPTGNAPAARIAGCTMDAEFCNAGTITRADLPADAPRFEQFRVPVARVPRPHPPVITADSRGFRTNIRRGAREGVNFAGHYTLVRIGCGAGCISWWMVDARTGRITPSRELWTTQNDNVDVSLEEPERLLVKYRPDSRLVIVIGDIDEKPERRGVSYFEWTGRHIKLLRFVPHADP